MEGARWGFLDRVNCAFLNALFAVLCKSTQAEWPCELLQVDTDTFIKVVTSTPELAATSGVLLSLFQTRTEHILRKFVSKSSGS
eukprot:4307694-Amphidinium_carterae.1